MSKVSSFIASWPEVRAEIMAEIDQAVAAGRVYRPYAMTELQIFDDALGHLADLQKQLTQAALRGDKKQAAIVTPFDRQSRTTKGKAGKE